MLVLADHWVWDFWLADDGQHHHVFFLKAPRSLGDPDLRHVNARIGHAVSDDLRRWQILADPLDAAPPGSWDERASWTGSVLAHDGAWYLFYSGISEVGDGLVQAIGMAHSRDLMHWERASRTPIVTADPRWYETLDLDVWIEETCRDPWVFPDPGGDGFHMYFTARANRGAPDGRGVIGHAWSPDLWRWQLRPPVTQPGEFGHLEVPQLAKVDGRHYLLFSTYEWAHSAARQRRAPALCGTHYLVGEDPLGPFRMDTDEFLLGSPQGRFYAGRLVADRAGAWQFMCWVQFAPDGGFVGALADPVPVLQGGDGRLALAHSPRMPTPEEAPRSRRPASAP